MDLQSEALDNFCGSEFWNLTVTWNTSNPDLTKCFEKTVLVWIPCLFLWIFAYLEVHYIKTSKDRDIPWNWKNSLKLIITAALCVICTCGLIVNSTKELGHPVNTYMPLFQLATFILAAILGYYNKKYGIQSSGVLFIFWFLFAACGAFQYQTEIRTVVKNGVPDDHYEYISYLIFYPLVLGMFLLNCFAEGIPRIYGYEKAKKKSPQESASFLSRITYVFFDGMMYKGFRRPLEERDMWNLPPDDSTEEIVPTFEKYFQKSLQKCKQKNYQEMRDTVSFKSKSGQLNIVNCKKKKREASVLPALCKSFYFIFLLATGLKLFCDLVQFVNPVLLGALITHVKSDEPRWKGILYAVLMFVCALLQNFLGNQYFEKVFIVGIRVRAALTAAIYRKSLRVSNTARKEKTVGEIVNLMASDAHKFIELTMFLNLVWSAPFQIIVATYLLWQQLGPSVLAGLGIMVLLLPINGAIINVSKKLQVKQMKKKDERVKIMNEILNGIKILKLYAWEPSFEQHVMKIRSKEINVLRNAAYLNAVTTFIWNCAPFMISCATFATYVLVDENNILDPAKAFVCIALYNILRFPLTMLPNVITQMVQVQVSLKRINSFLNADELDEDSVTHDIEQKDPLIVQDGTFSWGENPILKDINFQIGKGSLTAVVGPVGSGKSSLISALLGEMDKISGRVNTIGSIAYVPQQAWIQNATVQDNITFGKKFDKERYDKVIEACALKSDLEVLADGDQTEIGEKGINLSGGQKQRISLARAVYVDADVYLLDDPLSAVDSHVGKHIFLQLIGPTGLLYNKTRLLVTHGITYLPETDNIIVLKNGEIVEKGQYQELLDRKGGFAEFIMQHITDECKDEEELNEIEDQLAHMSFAEEVKLTISRQRSIVSESHSDTGSNQALNGFAHAKSKESLKSSKSMRTKSNSEKEKGKLIETEKVERGKVKWSVYTFYLNALGSLTIFATFVWNGGFQAFGIATNMWVGVWTEDTNVTIAGAVDTLKRDMYLGVYGALGLGQGICILIASILFAKGTMEAAIKLHTLVLKNVMRLPMAFFDVTPSGRILGRFSSDIIGVDMRLPMNFNIFIFNSLKVLGTMAVIIYTTPMFVAAIIPMSFLYMFIQRYYVATSRQLKRLESVTRSPIYSHFGETLSGSHVIRAYNQQNRFIEESDMKLDHNQMCIYPSNSSNRWLGVRLELIGNLIILFAALLAALGTGLKGAEVGLSVSYALQITQTLNFLVRMMSDVETNIVCVERIKEYGEMKQEAPWDIPCKAPNDNWPNAGKVEAIEYAVKYRPGLDLVLKRINFQIWGGEKIGIVGRTGAGKSSLTLSLFRIIEAAQGQILIDGVNIADIGLHSLRSKLTIIPQDAILFSGSLRMNLDPFDQHSDEDLWQALELAHLKPFVITLPAGLNHVVTEGGENLSVGQRQLICLARALLRKTKLLILDEATAAVDLETDDLIQKTIRTEFKNSTVITIAHRLNTIIDSDRVMVLDRGLIAEFDSPTNLLENKNSIFFGMCKDAGLVS